MKVLLLSAYDAESHRYWWQGLRTNLDQHEWTVLTLPSRYFSWRIRGNALTWLFEQGAVLNQPYDLIVATSMTDLSTLKGLVPNLSQTPTIVYFHENQFDYPVSGKEFKSVEPKILNLYTALAADLVLFNSNYNLTTFFAGLDALLKKLPDCVPHNVVEALKKRCKIIPVPLNPFVFQQELKKESVFNIVWNHRWEYDKNPKLLLRGMEVFQNYEINFKLHVVGKHFRKVPDEFYQLKELMGDKIGEWGYMESRQDYIQLLDKADVVLSTAIHDFQGISVLEGVAAGAVPVVPDRLAYKELFDPSYRYSSEGNEAKNLANQLLKTASLKQTGTITVPDISHLSWDRLSNEYQQAFDSVVSKN
ncbi:MAG: DUF3524 domain-containing protein [Neptuniibacter sp.]